MPELIVTQETIDRAYELWALGHRGAECCPMALQMAKFLDLEEETYSWGINWGGSGGLRGQKYVSPQSVELVVHPFDDSVLIGKPKLTGPITVNIEEVSQE